MTAYTADWYPDPGGVHELRYHDGTKWTEHVSNHGRQSVAPLTDAGAVPTTGMSAEKIQQQVSAKAGVQPGAAPGGGTIFTEPVLVVNQKAKLLEMNTEYAVYDQNGTQIGAIRQVGQSTLKKVARFVSSLDQFMTHTLQLVDTNGAVQLSVTRPAKFAKSKVHVSDAAGNQIGSIVQKNMIGKIRFSLEGMNGEIGSLNGENWRAWNFNLQDAAGNEVARITKTWEGLAKTMFTTADNYVLQIHRPLEEPMRSLVVASAVSVDLALKQDSRGLG
ncbi:MAG: phospholipid scramblase-related protein [Acidimicrobiales bacterium]|nr:phospholipid scramblase-related protein [Acidimicrobiales bacterium]